MKALSFLAALGFAAAMRNGSMASRRRDAPEKDRPIKMMVVGDSISHGIQDDYTWRWRIFDWLTTGLGYDIDFVGPWKGTHGFAVQSESLPHPPLLPGESVPEQDLMLGSYASTVSGAFTGSGHGAKWGRQAAQTKDTIQAWVIEHQPEYLLILLGFNDLGWFVSGPEELAGDMGQLVENARNGKPDIKILVGNVVDRTFMQGREDLVTNTATYNDLLRDRLPDWFRWESPIAYVDVNTAFDCRPEGCPDGWDGLHPNAKGEYNIAGAFAKVLNDEFGFEGPDLTIPPEVPPRTIETPTNVKTASHPGGLLMTWDMVPNARSYEIRSRVSGAADWGSMEGVSPNTHASWTNWLLQDGQTWEIQVRTRGDNGDTSEWSEITTATVDLETAPGPSNIVSSPKGDGIRMTWDAVTGHEVNRYAVIVRDMDIEGSFIETFATAGTSHFVGGLNSGHRYATWVTTYVTVRNPFTEEPHAAGGLPASGRDVIIGAGKPVPPAQLFVENLDPTTVRLTWEASAGASGYALYAGKVGDTDAKIRDGQTSGTTHDIAFLFPGTWNFEFCIAAFNGNLETEHTTCVTPSVYPGYEKRDVVMGEGNIVVKRSD